MCVCVAHSFLKEETFPKREEEAKEIIAQEPSPQVETTTLRVGAKNAHASALSRWLVSAEKGLI